MNWVNCLGRIIPGFGSVVKITVFNFCAVRKGLWDPFRMGYITPWLYKWELLASYKVAMILQVTTSFHKGPGVDLE